MTADRGMIRHARTLLPWSLGAFLFFFVLQQSIGLAAAAVILLGVVGLVLRWPNLGTLVVLFAIYSNIGVLAMRSQRAIQTSAGSMTENPRIAMALGALALLLAVPLVYQILVRKQPFQFDRGFALMSAYLGVLLLSSFFARDQQVVDFQITDYLLEGLGLYFLLTNVVRDHLTLRRAVWTLLLAGSLMGGLSVVQRATHTESKVYGGMAQIDAGGSDNRSQPTTRERVHMTEEGLRSGEVRAAGPIGEPNRYGQVLLVLLPLAVLQFRTERSRTLRVLALFAACLILGGMGLTFSRAALLTGVLVFAMMAVTGLLKWRQILVAGLGIALFVGFLEPEVATRVASLERLRALFSQTHSSSETPDSSTMRRYEENVAAWRVFLDHPIVGVGPGHFAPFYSIPYSNRIGLVEQTKTYRGHNLYLETLAETGVIGLLSFLAILLTVMHGLWKEHRQLSQSHPELAHIATGFLLALTAYAISAVFAHLSYQRYFWLLLALSSAAFRIVHLSSREASPGELIPGPQQAY